MGYYCGIDLASKRSAVCVINARRDVLEEREVTTDEDMFREVLRKYRGLTCVVEAAPLAEWLSRLVEELGHRITIVCPRKAKVAMHAKKKTDRRDARVLAELSRSGWYEAVHRKSEEARALRSYLTARKQLVECSTALATSIRGLLRAHGIKLSVGTDESGFSEKVRKAIEPLPELVRTGIEALLKSFEELHARQRELYKRLGREAKGREVTRLLQTVPGVGPATAAAFFATIDDPGRFSEAEKVVAYIGLHPSVHQSGETQYRGRITKNGDKLLRWLLVESAHIILSRSNAPSELKSWGLRLQETKGAGKARVAVARRLCGILWKMWKDMEPFHAEPLHV